MVEKLVGLPPRLPQNLTPMSGDKKGIEVNGKTIYPDTIEYAPEYLESKLKNPDGEKIKRPTIIYSKDVCDFSDKKCGFGPTDKENTLHASISPKEVCEWGAAAKIILDLLIYGYDAVVNRWGKGNADNAKAALLNACTEKECAEENRFDCAA